MKKLKGLDLWNAQELMSGYTLRFTIENSRCLSAKCGAIIVVDGTTKIIGTGANGPAGKEKCRCKDKYTIPNDNRHDLTCCVHAEWRAILSAMPFNQMKIKNSSLYFIRLSDDGKDLQYCDDTYCTVCSRLILEAGLRSVILYQTKGIFEYSAQKFNNLSYKHYQV